MSSTPTFQVERAAGVILLTLIAEAPHAYVFSEPLGEQPLGPVSILPATNSLADASRHVKQVRQVAEKFRKYDNAMPNVLVS
jgi:hypothetical protein